MLRDFIKQDDAITCKAEIKKKPWLQPGGCRLLSGNARGRASNQNNAEPDTRGFMAWST